MHPNLPLDSYGIKRKGESRSFIVFTNPTSGVERDGKNLGSIRLDGVFRAGNTDSSIVHRKGRIPFSLGEFPGKRGTYDFSVFTVKTPRCTRPRRLWVDNCHLEEVSPLVAPLLWTEDDPTSPRYYRGADRGNRVRWKCGGGDESGAGEEEKRGGLGGPNHTEVQRASAKHGDRYQ
ncbi:hypothetical protein CISG_09847 [Coccidioides immitis RMSCC 3703]|uniref:Uncharacterized protein n=1 Tax=Coccidioides immitis RMSCC 3703 TaxID=454286 RepID=A0A0J8QKB1_COCIT|nr:hypothetical protein CISG_09847 [Coccidioides immitis RMSCC 3703]